jgi:NADPH:quinone reductase
MKAIVIHRHGGPEVLKLEEVAEGKPGVDQALVQMKAIGVNFVDIYFRRGDYPEKLPLILGLEGAGVVEKVGPGVSHVKPGDRVAFVHQPAAYAEKCLVDANSVIPLPKEMSFEQGAAFPLQGMTAHYLLHAFYLPKRGDTVLIHAAAGGMGLLLVQWAKHLGAKVIGTTSTKEKAKIAKDAGANEVILYTEKDFAEEVNRLTQNHGADLIIDGVGKATFNGNLKAAAIKGHIVIFGAASGKADPIVPNSLMPRSLSLHGGMLDNYIATREEMMQRAKDVLEGIQKGWLKLRIHSRLPLAQAAEAHLLLENRQTAGKIILTV